MKKIVLTLMTFLFIIKTKIKKNKKINLIAFLFIIS